MGHRPVTTASSLGASLVVLRAVAHLEPAFTSRCLRYAETAMRIVGRDKCKRQSSLKTAALHGLVVAVLFPALACAQKPEYEFYFDFGTVFSPKIQVENHWSLTIEDVLDRYASKLRSEMVPGREIAGRIGLIRTDRPALDADYYNRFYLGRNSNFNHAPNEFLMEVMRDREPGAALDYGMGQGRNSVYLASIGWQVWGFDPADAGVALAQKRAKELGLTLHTEAVRDSEYDFGKEKFDLILFSWTVPLVPLQKVVDSLKAGGIVVMECGLEFYGGRNEMLHKFDSLQIMRYEMVRARSDFAGRREADIFRLVARKP